MTDTKPTLAEQIEHQIGICYATPSEYERAKLASLEELAAIKSQPVPVEPDVVKLLSEQDYEYNRKTNALIKRHAEQIDFLQSALQVTRHNSGVTMDELGEMRDSIEELVRAAEVINNRREDIFQHDADFIALSEALAKLEKQ